MYSIEYIECHLIVMKFSKYCKDFILDNIDSYEGESVYGCDLGYTLSEDINCDGCLSTGEPSSELIREWWDDASAYWEYEKSNFGENLHNPFDDLDAYLVCMVIQGVCSIIADCPVIEENWNNKIELTEDVISEIKGFVGKYDENKDLF